MTRLDLFFSYSDADEALRDQLETHLASLKREGLIRPWHHRRIVAGESRQDAIDARLEAADIILLLISADFIASDYCYEREMQRALQRHGDDQEAVAVVPILLRPCDWESSPFGGLEPLPSNRQPVQTWADQDAALLDVVTGLRRLVETLHRQRGSTDDGQREESQKLQDALAAAIEQRADLVAERGNTSEVDEEIRRIKRELRKGGQLRAGDFLLDGRLRLKSRLGEGGFGTVWKAYDKESQRVVAVKVLHSRFSRDSGRRDRFFRGARWMAQLHDVPGIVDVFERECEDDGFHFFVMEYVAGSDFQRAVESKSLNLAERLAIVLDVGDVLQIAHQRGIVHRDIKPSNILLDQDLRVRLTDFDLVDAPDTFDETTSALGTFRFGAPEALEAGSLAGVPADVFSLGMTMLFALNGELSIEARDNIPAFLDRLAISSELRAVLERALHPIPEARWPSVEAFCEAIRSLPEDGMLDPSSSAPAKRRRAAVGSTARAVRLFGGLVLVVVLVWGAAHLVERWASGQQTVGELRPERMSRYWNVTLSDMGQRQYSFLAEEAFEDQWPDVHASRSATRHHRWSVAFSAEGSGLEGPPPAAGFTYGLKLRSRWSSQASKSKMAEWLDHAKLWRTIPEHVTLDRLYESFGAPTREDVEAIVEITFDHETLRRIVHGVVSPQPDRFQREADALAAAMAWHDERARQSPSSRRQAFGEIWGQLLEHEIDRSEQGAGDRDWAQFWGLRAARHLEAAGLMHSASVERNGFRPQSGLIIPTTLSGMLFLDGSPVDEVTDFFHGLETWSSVLADPVTGRVAAPNASHELVAEIFSELEETWHGSHLMRAVGALLIEAAAAEGVLDQIEARLEIRDLNGDLVVDYSPQGYTPQRRVPWETADPEAGQDPE